MPLPAAVTEFLYESASREGQPQPGPNDDLFKSGVLDSFALIEFITLVEQECNIKVPDGDVNPGNFQSITAIENYVEKARG